MIIALEITKNGKPALWERGGCSENYGKVRLIAGKYAEPIVPIFIKNDAASNGQQALFLVRPDFLVIDISRTNSDVKVEIYKIQDIDTSSSIAAAEQLAVLYFMAGTKPQIAEKLTESYPQLEDAITSGVNKSFQVDCKIPYYFEPRRDRKCHL